MSGENRETGLTMPDDPSRPLLIWCFVFSNKFLQSCRVAYNFLPALDNAFGLQAGTFSAAIVDGLVKQKGKQKKYIQQHEKTKKKNQLAAMPDIACKTTHRPTFP